MANLSQFYRGEKIQITVTPSSGESISGCGMLVYEDDLDLKNSANASKVVSITTPTQSGESYVFEIPPTTSKNMESGSYTVELFYGDVTIVRANRAFLLVDSAYALTTAGTTATQATSSSNNGNEQ